MRLKNHTRAGYIAASFIFCVMALILALGASADNNDLTLGVQPGSSVVFVNNSTYSSFIHISPANGMSDCKADYGVYNSDGSVKSYGSGSRGLQNVPAGGKAVVTNSGSTSITVYGDSDAFSADSSSSPALINAKLAPGASAVFTCVSFVSTGITSGTADFAVYNSDGTLSGFGSNSGSLHMVPAGGMITVTNNSGSYLTAYGAFEAFTCQETSETALLRTTLAPGLTVVYYNKTSADCGLVSGKADYAIYNSDGTNGDCGSATSGTKTVPAGGKIVLTNMGSANADIYGASKVFTSEAGSDPALIQCSLESGVSVEFTNLTSVKASVTTGKADFATYDGYGVLTAFAGASAGSHDVASYGKIVVTNTSSSPVAAFAPYEAFSLDDSAAPALLAKSLSKGETVIYTNNSSAAVNVYISRADFASYDGYGAYSAYGADAAAGMYPVPAYGNIVITCGGTASATVYGPQAVFTAVGSDSQALLKTALATGETIIYFNTSSDKAPVNTGKADYCLYTSNGVVSYFGTGSSGEFSVTPSGTIKLTNTSTYPVTVVAPQRVFMAWSSSEPALYATQIAPGNKAVYYSTVAYDQSVNVGKCQICVYKYNGVLTTSRASFSDGSVIVPANGRIEVINNGTSLITLYGPYSCFAAKNFNMYKYDIEDKGLTLTLPTDILEKVDSLSAAQSAVKNALDSFDEDSDNDQRSSVTAIERLSLYIESAASRSAAVSVSDAKKLDISTDAVSVAAAKVKTSLDSLSTLPSGYKITLNRSLKNCVRFKCTDDTIKVSFSGDFSKVYADRIIIDTPSYKIYVDRKDISANGTITASVDKGAVTLTASMPVTLGLATTSGDTAGQVLTDSDGIVTASKFNPVSRLIEGLVVKSGTYSVTTNAKAFTDISDKSDEMRNAINFLAARGIINGTSKTTFDPNANISRAETAALLVRLLGKDSNSTDSAFADVSKSDWFASVAATSSKLGLIGGYEDSTFRGRNVITKNEILTVAARLLSSEMGWQTADASSLKYTDDVAAWVKLSAALAVKANICPERVDGSFSGDEGMTRGDAAIIIYRLYMLLW